MTSQTSPVTGATTYAYDPAGNLISMTDARGAMTTRTYDALGRLRSATSALGSASESVTYAYDDATSGKYGKGRLGAMSDPSGSTQYAYERRGLLRSETKTILGDTYTTSYGYDANGNRTSIGYPSGRRLTYAFDFADRPQSLSGTFNAATTSYISSASYLPFGPEASLTYAGGVTRNAAYDLRYRPTAFSVSAGVPLADYRYGFDAVGNITAITDALDARYSRSFGYDDLYRLTAANGGVGLWGNGFYAYDALGNRTSAALGTKTSSYTYQSVNGVVTSKLASVVEGTATRNIAYDPAGNEVQVGGATFVYSPRNYLDQGDGLRYVYDGTGMRVAQVGLSVGPIITTQPLSQPVCPGSSTRLFVVASGATGFQWQSFDGTNWNNLVGATSSSTVVAPTAQTQYRVIVSNAAASTTSSVATVTPTAVGTEPTSGVLYGDLNRDGTVDASDVAILRSVLAGKSILGVPQAVADLNGDGTIDAVDLALLGAFASHTIACLPQVATSNASSGLAAVTPAQAAANPTQYFFYTPEKNLLSRTEIKAAGGTPQIAVDYVWFNGHPVGEERIASAETRLTFTDHLGTPFLQTSVSGTPVWRAEYEPYGAVWTMRAGAVADQRLRLPGQEFDDETPEREYNIFRWYRSSWGRYSSADPYELNGGLNLFAYSSGNPVAYTDRLGLDTAGCDLPQWSGPHSACELTCCATHDKCYDDNHCSSGSWPGAPAQCGCDQTSGCAKCNSDVRSCFARCQLHPLRTNGQPMYYCAAQHRFIRIPGDFPDLAAAQKACEHDDAKDCRIPITRRNPKQPWYRRVWHGNP